MYDTHWFEKLVAAALGAFVLRWAAIPPSVGPLVVLMFVDLAVGSALAIKQAEWTPRKFGIGVMIKLCAFFMLGATAAVTEYAFTVSFDAMDLFVKAMTLYEFFSCAQSYTKLGGPGAPWLTRFIDLIQRTFEEDQNRDAVNDALARAKAAGDAKR